jgi:GNAT superfamily N-acetyltransferase
MYFWIILVIALVVILIYLFGSNNEPPFWKNQPVAHNLNQYDVGIIDSQSEYRVKLKRWIDDGIVTTNNVDKQKVTQFIKQNFYVEKDNVYMPDVSDIFNWLGDDYKISFYQDSIITTQQVSIICDNTELKCNYVDWLCVDKKYRKSGIAQKLIQTHESRLPIGAISLFKLDSKMDLTNIPITLFETKCYKFNDKCGHNSKDELTEEKYNKHLDYWKKYYNFICVPSFNKLNILIQGGQIIYANGFYYKKSCMYLHNCICYTLIAIVGTPCVNTFYKSLGYLPKDIYVCIETLGWCNEIVDNIEEPLYKSSAGLYFYNYYTEPVNKHKVVAII